MKKSGFTFIEVLLIEVLLIMAIVALVSAIGIPVIAGHYKRLAAQKILLNGLIQNKNPILVDKGLYYFKETGLDGFKAVQSFAEQHTNLTLVASFSVNETQGKDDYTPDWAKSIYLGSISSKLSLTTGYFAFFRPAPAE
jgi:hypothetical protein